MNLSLAGGDALVCNPTQKDSESPFCEFNNLPRLASEGCIIVSGDYYLFYPKANVMHKDRVSRTVLCYQSP